MTDPSRGEGLRIARLLMALSSIAPLFILWAIRGNRLIADQWFVTLCVTMVVVPYGFLGLRIWTAKINKDTRAIVVGAAEDHRDHLLVYLFAILLPFYTVDLATWRDVAAALAAIAFIVFAFWHLNLHYMNVAFAVLGYRVFTIYPRVSDNPLSARAGQVLITRRASVTPGEQIVAYRLSNTVYLELPA